MKHTFLVPLRSRCYLLRVAEDVEADKSIDVELEFWPKPLAWDSITLSVGAGDTEKEILRGCSGEVLPGEMMAIVGPSGKKLSDEIAVLLPAMKLSSLHSSSSLLRLDSTPRFSGGTALEILHFVLRVSTATNCKVRET